MNWQRLVTPTNDIFNEDILTNNNEKDLTENNHIPGNNNQSNLNRREHLFKNDNRDKNKQVWNIRYDCGLSPETSTPKLNIEIFDSSMINGITSAGWSSKLKNSIK